MSSPSLKRFLLLICHIDNTGLMHLKDVSYPAIQTLFPFMAVTSEIIRDFFAISVINALFHNHTIFSSANILP